MKKHLFKPTYNELHRMFCRSIGKFIMPLLLNMGNTKLISKRVNNAHICILDMLCNTTWE